jgi:hypothetical protein
MQQLNLQYNASARQIDALTMALHHAAEAGDATEIERMLWAQEVPIESIVDLQDPAGASALCVAAKGGHQVEFGRVVGSTGELPNLLANLV